MAQGASKAVYYAGGILLFFVPGLHLTRGGAAWAVHGVYTPGQPGEYGAAALALAAAALTVLGLLPWLARGYVRRLHVLPYRGLSAIALLLSVALGVAAAGWHGLLIMAAATGIGLIPVLFNSRRVNCLGIILLPMACAMSDVATPVVRWLGLL